MAKPSFVTVEINADSRYPINRERIREVVFVVLTQEGFTSPVVVSVTVIGDRKMAALNAQFHETTGTTDVLSFPYLDPESNPHGEFFTTPHDVVVLGDIAISYPQALKQAAQKGKLVDEEIDFLIEHGLQHLLGRHHD